MNRQIDRDGYVLVYEGRSPGRGWVPEHRWVMERHLGHSIPDGLQVHHKDGDRQNNNLSNLQLVTHAEHRAIHRKLDWDMIEALYGDGYSSTDIARMTGYSQFGVKRVLRERGVMRTRTEGIRLAKARAARG